MSISIKDKWDRNYQSCTNDFPKPAEVLFLNLHLLPESGTALDLACGRGANALCLSENGLSVSAWDISSSALGHLSTESHSRNLKIDTQARDISQEPPEPDSFDVICVSHFLDRNIMDSIKNAIKPNGLIFYQTFIKDKVSETGPSNPDYLLDKNELLNYFNDWQIVFYREEGKLGNTNEGSRNLAMLIAQKPSVAK